MRLRHGHHLAYCGNIHRGETWPEMFDALQRYTLAVRERVCPTEAYGIGLRLSARAAAELSEPNVLAEFRRWLERHDCYVFTINGFPYGRFHGQRVKEQVYAPDWTTEERLDYTNRLFRLLAELLPPGVEGSVSTVPGSFKEFITTPEQERAIRAQLVRCVKTISELRDKTGKALHLGLEPEPLCLLETTAETVAFFQRLREGHPNEPCLADCLGVNYDTCHLAVEFEEPGQALNALRRAGVKISKLHLSSALTARPTAEARAALAAFADPIYLHQVAARVHGALTRYRDLDDALRSDAEAEEWRIHFHVPLDWTPGRLFGNTADHLRGVLDVLAIEPGLCSHLEMETYTWEVLPDKLKNRSVVEQLAGEYAWCLRELRARGLA